MFNIKTVAAAVATVTVVGVSAHQIITRTRKDAVSPELEIVETSPFAAFNQAQDVISERTLSGYYDDKTDEQAQYDFQIMYNTYLKAA